MWWVEVTSDKKSRSNVTPYAEFIKISKNLLGKQRELYRSVYMYPERQLTQHLSIQKSVRNYQGPLGMGPLILDLEAPGHKVERLGEIIPGMLSHIHGTLGIDEPNVIYAFSGRGIHAHLHSDLFKWPTDKFLPHVVRRFIDTHFQTVKGVDSTVYHGRAIIRVMHTWNEKAGLFKIPLSMRELENFDLEKVQALAKQPRTDFDMSMYHGISMNDFQNSVIQLHEAIVQEETAKEFKRSGNEVSTGLRDGRSKMTCIHNIVDRGPEAGHRHNDIAIISANMNRQGIPRELTVDAMVGWVGNTSDEEMAPDRVAEFVNYVYEKGYTPWCNGKSHWSKRMQQFCDPGCIFFKSQGLNAGVLTVDEMEDKFKMRMEMIRTGQYIDLAKILNQPNRDLKVYPSQIITVMGAPGTGKSAFTQWLSLQFALPTLYLSFEMSEAQMFHRYAQMIMGMNKHEVVNQYDFIREDVIKCMDHIKMTTHKMDSFDIRNLIDQLHHKVIIVDHIGLVGGKQSDLRIKIKEFTNQLKQLVLARDMIGIIVSQVNRGDARNKDLNLHSGKESGSIEEDSDIVIGLNGSAEEEDKEVRILKARDGETFRVPARMNGETMRYIMSNEL